MSKNFYVKEMFFIHIKEVAKRSCSLGKGFEDLGQILKSRDI